MTHLTFSGMITVFAIRDNPLLLFPEVIQYVLQGTLIP